MSDRFVMRKLERIAPHCGQCGKAAIAWAIVPGAFAATLPRPPRVPEADDELRRAAFRLVKLAQLAVCQACGLDIQKLAANANVHVDVEEMR